jgi:hypothetical protein
MRRTLSRRSSGASINPAGYLKKHASGEGITPEIAGPSWGLPCVRAGEQVQAAAFRKNRVSAAISQRIGARVRALAVAAMDRAWETWHTPRPAENKVERFGKERT